MLPDSLNPVIFIDKALVHIGSLFKVAFMNVYNISFFIFIIVCMYFIIQAMCGSSKGKIGVVSTLTLYTIIEIIASMIL